ncbi:hypothetical protein ACWEF9_30815 [Streptomyces sp. NPDC004980]
MRRSGITRVEGNVIVDDRLFRPEPVRSATTWAATSPSA